MECCANVQLAVRIDRAAMALNNFSHGGQANAGSFIIVAAVKALEDREDLVFELVVKANAIVGNFQHHMGWRGIILFAALAKMSSSIKAI